MLTKKQIDEIREHLERSQNPLFFFDNDSDGLCAFLLLQRYIGRGKGVPIKSFPELNEDYFRKIKELNSDCIFILDKPVVSKEFFDEAEKINIPVVIIDHHKIDREKIPEHINYYNPIYNTSKYEGSEPTTFLCYQVSQKEEDLWIAIVGCLSDRYTPNFYNEFEKKYPDLSIPSGEKNAHDIYYKSQIGKIAKIFSFALKDRTTNVVNMLRFLMKAKSPYEVLEETSKNKTMHQRFEQINKKYKKLVEKAKKSFDKSNKILFFNYGGDLSISADLSNELMYLFPEKIIVVAYAKGIKVNISARGKDVRNFVLEAIRDIDGATGGGHDVAVGAQVNAKDLDRFRDNLDKIANSS